MDRRHFLIGTTVAAVTARPIAAASVKKDDASLAIVTTAADEQASQILATSPPTELTPRATLRRMRRLLTPFVWPRSIHHHGAALVPPIAQLLDTVERAQHDDGTFSIGNRHSPPDTAFLIEDMAAMIELLRTDRYATSAPIAARLKAMMRKAGPALATGGIHTPNHRWEVSAAIARIDAIDPHPAYRARIDDWLAEGIDVDADGIYSERSPVYASEVTNPSLLILAQLPGLSGLREIVRRNLETILILAEPTGGEVENVLSRRQDQDQRRITLWPFYVQFREMALRTGDARFAGAVRWIEQKEAAKLGDALTDLIERPDLARPLAAAQPPFVDGSRLFAPVGLVRQRRGAMTASLYAGSDWYADGKPSPFYNRIGSGLATNPTLLRLWKNELVVEGVRLIPDFFGMGHFRPATITLDPDGTVRMAGELAVPYYQPLPRAYRRADGAYPLTASIDHRFNSALDFERRPVSMRRLGIAIRIVPDASGYRLLVETDGEVDVGITIEITLRSGGVLEGARPLGDGSFHLIDGQASYRVGQDRLLIGPGAGSHPVKAVSGDNYAWGNGQLQLPGTWLYVTGRTPFRHELQLTFA